MRSVQPDMLVMWDRGLHAYDQIEAVVSRGAHVLARLPARVAPRLLSRLEDGSWRAWLPASDPKRRATGEGRMVRVIAYWLDEAALPEYGQTHRLITTLLDAQRFPACDLVGVYHGRWEVEVALDIVQLPR